MQLWQTFLNMNEIAFPDLSKMIRVMLSIPPSTGWIERAYSVLENMSEEVEPVRSWITEAPIFFSSFETSCQRQFWLLERT